MFRAMRMQKDQFGLDPDYRVKGLSGLPPMLAAK